MTHDWGIKQWMNIASEPSFARVVEVLDDRPWSRQEYIELPSGERRVRKTAAVPGPWGVNAVRAEAQYLLGLRPGATEYFPALRAAWGLDPHAAEAGYERDAGAGWKSAARLVAEEAFLQAQADSLQGELAETLRTRLQQPETPRGSLALHIDEALRRALRHMERDPATALLAHPTEMLLNGHVIDMPWRALLKLIARGEPARMLAGLPHVLLHGNLLLEHILWREDPPPGRLRLLLTDPVSEAGIAHGPALFDGARYEWSASGERHALAHGLAEARQEPVTGEGLPHFHFRVRWEAPALRPFRLVDLRRIMRGALASQNEAAPAMHALLEAYFILTEYLAAPAEHRLAYALRAAQSLHEAARRP